jgi:hypothetical protein
MTYCGTCGSPGHTLKGCPVGPLNAEQEAYQSYREYCAQSNAQPMDIEHWKRFMSTIGSQVH